MDPYKVLGLDKSASVEEIKKAYRELVKVHHPDVGGDDAMFREVTLAYKILVDPVLRSKYDSGESVDSLKVSKDMIESEAVSTIATLYISVISQSYHDNVNVLNVLREHITRVIRDLGTEVADLESRILKLYKIKDRFTLKKGEENIFVIVTDNHISEIGRIITRHKHSLKVNDKALEILNDYDFKDIETLVLTNTQFTGFTFTFS